MLLGDLPVAYRIGLDILLGQVMRPAPSCDSLSENMAGYEKDLLIRLSSNSNTLSRFMVVLPPSWTRSVEIGVCIDG